MDKLIRDNISVLLSEFSRDNYTDCGLQGIIGRTGQCHSIIFCFKGQFHVFRIISVIYVSLAVMNIKELKQADIVGIDMLNQLGNFQQLAEFCCG